MVEEAGEAFLVTPTLPPGLEWFMSDTDRARHAADQRLDTISDVSSRALRGSAAGQWGMTPR